MNTRVLAKAKASVSSTPPVRGKPLQRKCACGGMPGPAGECEECRKRQPQKKIRNPKSEIRNDSSLPAIVGEVLNSPGQALDATTRAFMESRFHHDFGHVRVHADAKAADSARAVSALAYTVGQDVVFGANQFAPTSYQGRQLLAHELAHTVQQRGSDSNQPPSDVSQIGHACEVEADRAADLALSEKVPAIHLRARSVLARQETGGQREVPGPSPGISGEPEEERFEEAVSKPRGREKISAPATWGWGAPETNNVYQECRVAPMTRERFLKFEATLPRKPPKAQRRKPTEGPKSPFGATWPDLAAAVAPEIVAESVKEDGKTLFRLKPTHAEMPPIKSGYTQAELFREGEATFMVYEASGQRVCPGLGGRAPLFWQITEGGAGKIWAGEMEHCSDIRAAFDATLVLFASAINNEAAADRRYGTEKQAIDETKKRLQSIPSDPVDMLNAYGQEIEKTRLRDTLGWHEGATSDFRQPQENNCKGYLGSFSEKSFPEVGDGPGKEKHPPQEVLQGTAGKIKGKP